MLRAAAKNHDSVSVVVDPEDYATLLEELTAHDGQWVAGHEGVRRALARIQSPTSLRLLLRSPLGFVWRYALGWYAPREIEQPLTIGADD